LPGHHSVYPLNSYTTQQFSFCPKDKRNHLPTGEIKVKVVNILASGRFQ
jgi:hypothetical protein